MNEGITSYLIFSSFLSGEVIVHSEEFGLLLHIEIYFNPYGFLQWGGEEKRKGAELKKMPTLTFQAPPEKSG